MECYSPFCFLHQFFIPHSPHFGLRAVHTYRPCKINQWCALDNHSAGILATSCFSVSSGVRAPVTNPIRSATRNTCVSTGIAGRPKATASITFAVFRPTPGKVCSNSKSDGTSPLNSFINFFAIADKCLDLLFGYDIDRINSKISSIVAPAIASAVGNRSNNAGVTIFTRLSVHCADRMTATSNWKGLL